MPVNDAKKFINKLMTISSFRNDFLKITTKDEMNIFLKNHNLDFNNNDFDKGLTYLLVNCQHESLAAQYYQINYLYETINSYFD